MAADAVPSAAVAAQRLHLRVARLCGAVLFFEGYDIASVGYAVPSLVDAWKVRPPTFTPVLTAGPPARARTKRDALFMVIHDRARPWNTFVEWKPKGLQK